MDSVREREDKNYDPKEEEKQPTFLESCHTKKRNTRTSIDSDCELIIDITDEDEDQALERAQQKICAASQGKAPSPSKIKVTHV